MKNELPSSVWDLGAEAVGQHLLEISEPISYEKLITPQADIIYFGENHADITLPMEIRLNAVKLAELGISTILLEAPDTDEQRKLFELINQGFLDTLYSERIDIGPSYPESIAKKKPMIEAFYQAGIKVLPIDYPSIDPGRENPMKREAYLKKRTKEIRDSLSGGIITLIGQNHGIRGKHLSVINLLEKQGYNCQSIVFVGGSDFGEDNRRMKYLDEGAHLAGISMKRFMFQPNEPEAPLYNQTDWIVHLTQITRV